MVYALKTRVDPAWSRIQVNGFTLSEKSTTASRSVNDRITRFLINGENVIRMDARVELGQQADGEISVVRPSPDAPEDELTPLAQAAMVITPPAVAGEAVIRLSVSDVPHWSFQEAPPVSGLAAEALRAAEILVKQLQSAVEAANADAVVDVLRHRLNDSAIELGAPQIDRWREAMRTMLQDESRRFAVAPRNRWIAEPALSDRVMHIRVAGGAPLVSVEAEVGDMLLTLGLARLNGVWTVVR